MSEDESSPPEKVMAVKGTVCVLCYFLAPVTAQAETIGMAIIVMVLVEGQTCAAQKKHNLSVCTYLGKHKCK